MAEITSQEQFEKVREALKAGKFADDPAIQDEILAAAEAWKASQPESPLRGYRRDEPVRFSASEFPSVALGAAEGALSTATGALANIPAGFAGLLSLGKGPDVAAEKVESVRENLTYQPRTREGELGAEGMTLPFRAAERGADLLGEGASTVTGSPAIGAGIKSSVLMAPALAGRGGVGRGPLSHQQTVLQKAQAEGYVVPTSTANPTSAGRGFVEGVAGKPRMQKVAAFRNQKVTNELAAKELGLPEGTTITRDVLDGVRAQAGQAYSVLDNAGTITTNVVFRRDLANAVADLKKVSKDFEVLAKKDSPVQLALEIADGLNKSTFQSSSAIKATRILREEATKAFRNNEPTVGQAYRDMSKAVENAAEAHLVKFGDPKAVQAFRDARQTIAKSYSIEKALDGDGFVSAPNLASQLKKREPLSGSLKDIAEFAEQFPSVFKVTKEVPIQTGRLSAMLGTGSLGMGMTATNPAVGLPLAAVAFGGPLLRNLLLSKAGQATVGKPVAPVTGVPGAMSGSLLSGLLAQPEE